MAIRAFKAGDTAAAANASKNYVRIDNKDRPDEAYTTERAVRAGRANAASGRIMVNIPNDHFGPIPAEADTRDPPTGIKVGEWWADRLTCRQWGAHFPHVAGIAGQSNVGAQSVVLSGGYEDDKDEGEWFLYTGSGGRDLSGNKRTNKQQSFDQKFDSMNKALQLSCLNGLPVRVVRSFKEKRSAYAPSEETPVRYDGIYRIVKCWRKAGAQGFLMCRYLFVRCDNEPAPWAEDDCGDSPDRQLPSDALAEMNEVIAANGKAGAKKETIFEMKANPWWDWNPVEKQWGWSRSPPVSQKTGGGGGTGKKRSKVSEEEKALKESSCGVCKNVLLQPVSTPCGHHFCKPCLEKKFAGVADEMDAGAATGRSLRVRKIQKPCPVCKVDIADFLRSAHVNRDMEALIKKLQDAVEHQKKEALADEVKDDGEGEEENEGEGEGAVEGCEMMDEARPLSIIEEEVLRNGHARVPAAAAEDASAVAKHALAKEFTEFDIELIGALLEQEDGNVADVRFALRRMRDQEEAEKKKREKAARAAAKAALSPPPPPPPQLNGKRGHSATSIEEEGMKKSKN